VSSGQQFTFNFGRDGFYFRPPAGATSFDRKPGPPGTAPESTPPQCTLAGHLLSSTTPQAIIYYETYNLSSSDHVGYQNAASNTSATDSDGSKPLGDEDGKYTAVIGPGGQLEIAGKSCGPTILETSCVGCGVTFEEGPNKKLVPIIFFTVDGVCLGNGLRLGPGRHRIFPWVAASRPRPNFGQQRFSYPAADSRSARGTFAQQLFQWASSAQGAHA